MRVRDPRRGRDDGPFSRPGCPRPAGSPRGTRRRQNQGPARGAERRVQAQNGRNQEDVDEREGDDVDAGQPWMTGKGAEIVFAAGRRRTQGDGQTGADDVTTFQSRARLPIAATSGCGLRARTGAGAAGKGCNGAPDRIRTCDLRLRRPTLYPLSYRRAKLDHTGSRLESLGFSDEVLIRRSSRTDGWR
jgi:hypothetical protein